MGWPSLDRVSVNSFGITKGKTGNMDADGDGWGVQVVEAYGSSLLTTSISLTRNKKQDHHESKEVGGVYGLGNRKCRGDIYNSELTGQRKVSLELCGHTDQ